MGGFAVTPWKKLNGARFVRPPPLIEETQAIGRGAIVLIIQPYSSARLIFAGSDAHKSAVPQSS